MLDCEPAVMRVRVHRLQLGRKALRRKEQRAAPHRCGDKTACEVVWGEPTLAGGSRVCATYLVLLCHVADRVDVEEDELALCLRTDRHLQCSAVQCSAARHSDESVARSITRSMQYTNHT